MTGLELRNKFMVRLRGPAHTPELIRTILAHAQCLVNARLGHVLVTETLTTRPRQQVYSTALLTDSLRVVGVRESNRDLAPALWRSLGFAHRHWFRRTGSRFEVFSRLGRNLLILHPAKPEQSSVSVASIKLTGALGDTDQVELSDEDLPPVLDLAEAVLLLRERRFESLKEVLTRLAAALGISNVQDHDPTARR